MQEYAELHCHSAFSLLDGASLPEELAKQAKQIGLSALALTDHDDMGGIVRFAQAAQEISLNAITGVELTLEGNKHIILLAEDIDGYKNICSLITKSRCASTRGSPNISLADLANYSKGIIALSGCHHGLIASELAQNKIEQAENYLIQLKEIFAGNFFLELWDHNIAQEAIICRQLFELATKYTTPWLVTNNVHYAYKEKSIIHDVLTCLKHQVTLSTAGRRLRPNNNWYLKSPEEICQQWRHHLQGVKNTLIVAERCRFRLPHLQPVLPTFRDANNLTDQELLEQLVWQGAAERYGADLSKRHTEQIKHELAVIGRLKVAPYFLIMRDIIQFANSQSIAIQGRGSAANSAICYCLKITAVDPIGMNLLFERFISEERNEPPDIDLDIAHQEREKVLQYVYNKYGREHAAMVCEHVTYRGRSAVRDVARVFDFSQEQADKLASAAHHMEAYEIADSLRQNINKHTGLDLKSRRVQMFLRVIAGLDQLPRHRSIHVGGFVLSKEPIGQMVPVEPAAMKDRTIIQWDKYDLEIAGLIKIDLLGLGMLTMLQEGMRLIKKHRQEDIDLAKLKMDDQRIYSMLQKGDTIGLFQVESRAQISILPKLKPEKFYDIVVSISLVRPGPIQGNIVHPYLRRRRGLEEVVYLHKDLEPILERTLGVPLFQEQGMRLSMAIAGFSALEADELRRVMSHKRSKEKMEKLGKKLADGMRKNNIAEEIIETITFQLQAFANYGFPESHSISFALLTYASAFLKEYYAPEFYCATLNSQPMGFYSPATLIQDALRHNVEIRSVDITKSEWNCSLENQTDEKAPALRIGLKYVSGLGYKTKSNWEKTLSTDGPFVSLEDVVKRNCFSAQDLQNLANAGAFTSLYPDRRKALWKVLALSKTVNEAPLLKTLLSQNTEMIPEMTELEKTIADYKHLGLSAGAHPMSYFRTWAKAHKINSCHDLEKSEDGDILTIAGAVICRQRPPTAKGFVFLTLEDETGLANVILKPKLFALYEQTVLNNHFLAITGNLQKDSGTINIIARKIKAMPAIQTGIDFKLTSHDFH